MGSNDDHSRTLPVDQQDLLTMHMWEAFMEQDAQNEALGLQEPEANETTAGEKGIKLARDGEMGNSQGDVSNPNALPALYQGPHPLVVEEDDDWASQFFEEAAVPVGEAQDSFTQNDASFNVVEVVSSIFQDACSAGQNSPSSNTLAPDCFLEHLLTDTEIQEALRLGVESYHTPSDSSNLLSHLPQSPIGISGSSTHLPLPSGDMLCLVQQSVPPPTTTEEIYLEHGPYTGGIMTEEQMDKFMKEYEILNPDPPSQSVPRSFAPENSFVKYKPRKTPARNVQSSMQRAEQPVPRVNQVFREMENQLQQSEVTSQAEEIIEQVPLNHQVLPLNVGNQNFRPVDVACKAKKSVVPFENNASNIQSAHNIDTSPGQLHMPMPQQNDPNLQYRRKGEQTATKMASRVTTSIDRSEKAATFVHDHQVQTHQVSTEVTSDAKYHGELEKMHGSSAYEPNENLCMLSEQHSDQGLAGVFGITLDQAKSGMRNTKAIVRNTMIEKTKPTASSSLLQYAGVKKPKSPKAKLLISPNYVQAEREKKCLESVAALDVQQPNDKPIIDKTIKPTLPPMVTAEQFAAIQEAAKAKAFIFFQQIVKDEVRKIQREILQQNGQAVSGQNVPYPSPSQSAQQNPYHLQQQGMQQHGMQQQEMQTSRLNHAGQTPYYAQQQHAGQAIDTLNLMPANHAAPNQVQQQGGYVAQGQSPIQGQPAPYNMPQGTPQYPFLAGNQGVFYPSPQNTPRIAGQGSSYVSPMNDSHVVGHQSPHAQQMAAFNNQQQGLQMGAHPGSQQAWQFAQQGHQVQQQVYYAPLQHTPQQVQHYFPIPSSPSNRPAPQYDPQNHARYVSQQQQQLQQGQMQRQQMQQGQTQQGQTQQGQIQQGQMQQGQMHQDQMQRQQLQQAHLYHQSSMEENLAYSAKAIEQAKSEKSKRQFNIDDFVRKNR